MILQLKDPPGLEHEQSWNYHAVIGCLNYIQGMMQPNLSYTVHQFMHFCNSPRLSHEQALKRICHYLKATCQDGLFFTPNLSQGFQCFVDADWAGNWIKSALNDLAGALSRTGFLIIYANCPNVWGSKMQTLVALNMTVAKIVALSTALRKSFTSNTCYKNFKPTNSTFLLPNHKSNVTPSRTMQVVLK